MYSHVMVRIVSLAPLLMHNVRLSDPLNEFALALKKVSSVRKKELTHHQEMSEIEFKGGSYSDEGGHPIIPGEMLEATIVNGAKKNKLGKQSKSAILVDGAFKLEYEGPKTVEKLWEGGKHIDRRAVSVNNSKIMRTRPRFDKWALNFKLSYLPDQMKEDEVRTAVENAGRSAGIGDYRPKFGRFEIESWKPVKN